MGPSYRAGDTLSIMARSTKQSTDGAPQGAPSDVLVYNEAKQPISIAYYNKKAIKGLEDLRSVRGAANLSEHTRFTPGLYLVRGRTWPRVKESSMWARARDERRLVPVAGHQDGLEADWHQQSPRQLTKMVERTIDARTLLCIQDLENGAPSPRVKVSEAIDRRRKEIQHLIDSHLERTGT